MQLVARRSVIAVEEHHGQAADLRADELRRERTVRSGIDVDGYDPGRSVDRAPGLATRHAVVGGEHRLPTDERRLLWERALRADANVRNQLHRAGLEVERRGVRRRRRRPSPEK